MQHVASSDGVVLAVYDLGGTGRPVLACHATGLHARVWTPVARSLAAAGYHTWALDFRGHGASGVPDGGVFAWDGFADDVLAVVDALDLDRPFGLGHSKGGAALLLAEERRPGTFQALYLYEPVVVPADPPPGPDPSSALARGARRRRDRFADRSEARANFASKPPFDVFDPEVLDAYVEGGFVDTPEGDVRLACRPESEAATYTMGTAHRAWAGLDRVRIPVVVAAGNPSDSLPALAAPLVAAALPHGTLAVDETLGHFGPQEQPARVAASAATLFDAQP